jgi:hypothetical protein
MRLTGIPIQTRGLVLVVGIDAGADELVDIITAPFPPVAW